MKPYIFWSIIVTVSMGIVYVPWGRTLQKMDVGSFSVVLGSTFCLAGCFLNFALGSKGFRFDKSVLLPAIVTAALYVATLTTLNFVFSMKGVVIPVTAAILAGFPVVTQAVVSALDKKLPSPAQVFFMLLVVAGVAGLSLTGSKH